MARNQQTLKSEIRLKGIPISPGVAVARVCLFNDARHAQITPVKVADFGSMGTNDLFQYLFALDRDNEWVAWDYRPDHPVFWSLIRGVAKSAADCGKPLSVCGELAGMPEYTVRLLEAGVKAVSVNPHQISKVRRTVAKRLSNR